MWHRGGLQEPGGFSVVSSVNLGVQSLVGLARLVFCCLVLVGFWWLGVLNLVGLVVGLVVGCPNNSHRLLGFGWFARCFVVVKTQKHKQSIYVNPRSCASQTPVSCDYS